MAVAFRDITSGLHVNAEGVRSRVDEVPSQEDAQHHRRVDIVETVDGIVVDLAALRDVLDKRTETEIRMGNQVAREFGSEEVDVGRGPVELADPKAPERHGLVVPRALVVRRVIRTEADRTALA
jgi:hypothetical protein